MNSQNFTNLSLAQHFLEIGQPERALEHLQRADSDTIESPFFWHLQGRAHYDLEKYTQAITAVKKGLALSPDARYLLYLLCNCHSCLGDLAAAERAILSGLHQNPEDPQLLCRYAVLVSEAGQLEKAQRLLDKAAQIAPDHPAVANTRITLAYLRGDDKEATAVSRQTLSQNPHNLYGQYMLGGALAAQGKVYSANRHFQSAARLDPTDKTVTGSTRQSRLQTHWLLIPLWPAQRFGPVAIWIAAIVIIFSLNALDLNKIANGFTLVYIIWVVYSWVVPPLLKRWLQRKYRSFR
jgi:predicted Zn-dependent protease